MEEKKVRKRKITLTVILGLLIIGFGGWFVFYTSENYFKDMSDLNHAKIVVNETKRLRIALEKYYQISGKYPNLTEYGVWNNLKELDYTDNNGKKISFADIYGSNTIASTPVNGKVEESNVVYDKKYFDNGTLSGGWNYNYTEQTGEIHPNIRDNAFFQGIKWEEF